MRYDQIVIDPPWPKKKGGKRRARPKQTRSLDYRTLSTPEIFALLDREVFTRAATTHNVWMWSIDQFLHASEQCMADRGYRLHARIIWDKTNGVCPAFTIRYSHEYLLWFYKPRLAKVAENRRGKYRTVLAEKSREHSRKPDSAYSMIEDLCPNSSYLDVFSRELRKGWGQYGDQVDYFQ